MKRTVILVALLALLGATAFAESFQTLFPKNAKIMGLGGSFAAVPQPEFAFFGNPAAFGSKKASFTLASVDAWTYIKPTTANIQSLSSLANDSKIPNVLATLGKLMPGNGMGGGGSLSFGFAGKGFGLGIFAVTDEYIKGDSLPAATILSDTQVNAVVGLGLPIINAEGFRLVVGGDLRPFYRLRPDSLAAATLVKVLLDPLVKDDEKMTELAKKWNVSSGFGLAMDLGASLEVGPFTVGMSARDISPNVVMWHGTFQEFLDALNQGGLPSSKTNTSTAVFLPNISAGFAYNPRFLPGFVDPSIYVELQDPIGVIQENRNPLTLLHAGAELRLLSFIYFRGGINRGWLSAGAGLKLLFLDVNAAVFTEELGKLPGDRPRTGLAVQAAIRF